jgi:hypothetical protein
MNDSNQTTAESQPTGFIGAASGPISEALLPVGHLAFITPFIALMFYASMNTDDYSKATLSWWCVRQPSVFAVTSRYYMGLNGRWFTNLLEHFVMSKAHLTVSYGLLLLLIMLSNVTALGYFFAKCLRVPYTRAFLAGGLFYAAWIAGVSSPGDNVYWLTVAFEYQLTITSMLLLAGLLCKSTQTLAGYIGIALLAVAIPAQHEVAGVFLVACLFGGVVAAHFLKVRPHQWWLGFGLASMSLASVLLSPGSMGLASILLSRGPSSHPVGGHFGDLSQILPFAKRATEHGINWTINLPVLLCAPCIPFVLERKGGSTSENSYMPPRWLALAGLSGMVVLLAEFAGVERASGYGVLPPRVEGWFQFVFWFLLVCVIVIGVPEISQIKFSAASRIALSMLFMVSVLGSENFHSAEKDLRGPAGPWHAGSAARLRQRGDSLVFDALPPKPALFRNTSLAADDGCWVNQCMAVYLGARSIVAMDPSENAEFHCASRH